MLAGSTRRPPGIAGSGPLRHWLCSSRSASPQSTPTISAWPIASAQGSGIPPGDSALVFVDKGDAADRLERAGIRAAVRNGRLRTSWHVYNTDADVDRALAALA